MVVADTSPLNYLVLIGSIDVLPELYERVLVPFEVIEELSAADAPAEVAVWVRSRPAWLEVQVVPWSGEPWLTELDLGEQAAIRLERPY